MRCVSINQDRFWALMESLLDTGYLPTENIIVLEDSKGIYHVREGNRRIGALKIAFNYLSSTNLSVPDHTKITLEDVLRAWRWAFDRKAGHDVGDQDAIDVFDEIDPSNSRAVGQRTDLMQHSRAHSIATCSNSNGTCCSLKPGTSSPVRGSDGSLSFRPKATIRLKSLGDDWADSRLGATGKLVLGRSSRRVQPPRQMRR